MKIASLLTVSALATAMTTSGVMAANTNAVSPEQKKQFEQIIHDYLVASPEVLIEASQALQQKQQLTQEKEAKSAISENVAQLLNGQLAVAGNPKGDVTVVEFFDYQCIHCKKMKPIMIDLVNKNSNVRVVFKEFPIFGKTSEIASRAALAAAMQGKYLPMQSALLQQDKRLDKQLVLDTAKSIGLDMAKLQLDMESKQVTAELDANRALAEKMHLMGTPAIVVLSTPVGQFKPSSETGFIPGGATAEALQSLVDKAAAK
ncbi:MAG TPA: DsbA family protein [Legionella sp.]|nr:DsbA family protein [Legionella sp.]